MAAGRIELSSFLLSDWLCLRRPTMAMRTISRTQRVTETKIAISVGASMKLAVAWC